MISISDAKNRIDREIFRLRDEEVPLSEIKGRILAGDIFADMDLPPFERSQMDGFAVRSRDTEKAPAKLEIVGESVAGKGWHKELKPGEAVRIMTGASVPKGADAVQKVELTRESEGFVFIEKPADVKQNIVGKGEEIKKGARVFEQGETVSENMIAGLASFGCEKIRAARRPRVKILATGSEIVDVSETPGKDQIRNSNSWSLRAFAQKYADVEILPEAADDLQNLTETISASAEKCDCLIISGGVSVGDYDFTKPALRKAGAEIFFEKVSLKPGKPTVFAKLGKTLIFGLPGNPVSAAVTFFVFVRRALLAMQGAKNIELESGSARLAREIRGARGRDALLPVSVSSNDSGESVIETLRFAGSSNFLEFARANALVFVPGDEILEKNEIARIFYLR